MALFRYHCPKCNEDKRILRKSAPTPDDLIVCDKCGGLVMFEYTGVSSRAVEVLDNGLMARRVERIADAERLFKERADADQKRRNQS